MCCPFLVLSLALARSTLASAQVRIGIGLPNVSIGINCPPIPTLVPVPGYPVDDAPGVNGNYFFYYGMYWVFMGDAWYASSWYNGPWVLVDPGAVPLFILRVPVKDYRKPPPSSAAGRGGRRPAGAITGDRPGSRATGDGTSGIATRCLRPRGCRITSGITRAGATPGPSSSRRCTSRTTTTSPGSRWCATTTRDRPGSGAAILGYFRIRLDFTSGSWDTTCHPVRAIVGKVGSSNRESWTSSTALETFIFFSSQGGL